MDGTSIYFTKEEIEMLHRILFGWRSMCRMNKSNDLKMVERLFDEVDKTKKYMVALKTFYGEKK